MGKGAYEKPKESVPIPSPAPAPMADIEDSVAPEPRQATKPRQLPPGAASEATPQAPAAPRAPRDQAAEVLRILGAADRLEEVCQEVAKEVSGEESGSNPR